jgi:hypothetical protein
MGKITARSGTRLLDVIGEDTIAMASKWLENLPQDTQDKITVGNASRVYNFTPADPATIPAD